MVKKQKTTYFVKKFPLFANFPSTKFWSSYIAWLYIKRAKLHTKGPFFSNPLFADLYSPSLILSFRFIPFTLLCRNFTHFDAKYTFSHFLISLTRSIFIDNNITHILQHTIIHYRSFPTLHYSETSSSCCPKTHLHLILYFSYKIPLLRKQHNQCHNTKNNPSSSLYYI